VNADFYRRENITSTQKSRKKEKRDSISKNGGSEIVKDIGIAEGSIKNEVIISKQNS
jgi:hypothetical protein